LIPFTISFFDSFAIIINDLHPRYIFIVPHFPLVSKTREFKTGLMMLENAAEHKHTAFMCSEAVWWWCPRSLISDYLKLNGWKVLHIINKDKAE
jgi:hypothetical protein